MALVAKGWKTPCRIFETDGAYSCEMNGEAVPGAWTSEQLEEFWAQFLTAERTHPLVQLVCHGEPCDETTYLYRVALKDWALKHSPQHPAANPRKPINLRLTEPDEF